MKELILTGKHANGRTAKVDDDLFDYLDQWKWWVNPDGYAVRGGWADGRSKLFRLHRVVMGAKQGQFIDHINRDRLDCRRSNLRFCSIAQNNANADRKRSGFKGVYFDPRSNPARPWSAKISVQGHMIHIGYFEDPFEAAYVFDQFSLELHGDFARTNLPL